MIRWTATLVKVWNESLCLVTGLHQQELCVTAAHPWIALLQYFNANIPVLSEHWLTGVQLQRKDAIE